MCCSTNKLQLQAPAPASAPGLGPPKKILSSSSAQLHSITLFFGAGVLMTTSMDIHTQLGPNMAHSAQNGLVPSRPRCCRVGHIWTVMPRTSGLASKFQAIWHFEAKCQSQLNIPPSVWPFYCPSVCLSVQRLQSRALEPLMVVALWCFS